MQKSMIVVVMTQLHRVACTTVLPHVKEYDSSDETAAQGGDPPRTVLPSEVPSLFTPDKVSSCSGV